VLARQPSKQESAVLTSVAAKQPLSTIKTIQPRESLLAVGESKADTQLPVAELAAWTNVATMILNLDEAITKE
jgi:hypothetical protein